jgi:hypothetical protein
MPIRPRTDARRESAGPVLLSGGPPGLPHGQRMRLEADGTVRIDGGFLAADGAWRRRDVAFRFGPDAAGGGVRLRIPAEAGDRLEYSVFFRDDPQSAAGSVFDGELRVSSDALHDVAFEAGYASGAEPRLVRARMTLEAAAAGPVEVVIGPA